MFAILPKILPANLKAVNTYLSKIHQSATNLYSSVSVCYWSNQSRFKSFVDAEEARLKKNLEAVRYDIDAADTLLLITGPGRIERVREYVAIDGVKADKAQYLFPVLYLLFQRHFEIFRVCQHRVIHPDELEDAYDTVLWVFDAVDDRIDALESEFEVFPEAQI